MSDEPDGLIIIVGALIAAAVMTWIVGRLLGRRIAMRNLVVARFVTAFFVPALTITFGLVRAHIDAAAHPNSDMPGMALFGTMVFSVMLLAATVPMTMASVPHR
ncbi:hypothetical protein ACSBM8_01620 [Sphingomonas sp. ASY06-1R]|uniref:hypothetical protein n=1 Tax=Sphingomonas sp. ASY06-1R TaxID=3445771 RepID=UPI003FA30A87